MKIIVVFTIRKATLKWRRLVSFVRQFGSGQFEGGICIGDDDSSNDAAVVSDDDDDDDDDDDET